MEELTREQLVERLAEVSHGTYNRHLLREGKKNNAELPEDVTDHDLERAEDIVRELERLAIWPKQT